MDNDRSNDEQVPFPIYDMTSETLQLGNSVTQTKSP